MNLVGRFFEHSFDKRWAMFCKPGDGCAWRHGIKSSIYLGFIQASDGHKPAHPTTFDTASFYLFQPGFQIHHRCLVWKYFGG